MRTKAKSCTCERTAPGSNKGWVSSMWKSLAVKDWGTLMDNMLSADWQSKEEGLCSREGQLNSVGKNKYCFCKSKFLPLFALMRLQLE